MNNYKRNGAVTSSRRKPALRTAMVAALLAGTTLVTAPDMAFSQSYRFNSVQVDGNARIETGTILSYAGIARGQSVSAVAFEVGYESPTQFSREYARKFGASPRHDLRA